jgi:hypothetical protein
MRNIRNTSRLENFFDSIGQALRPSDTGQQSAAFSPRAPRIDIEGARAVISAGLSRTLDFPDAGPIAFTLARPGDRSHCRGGSS